LKPSTENITPCWRGGLDLPEESMILRIAIPVVECNMKKNPNPSGLGSSTHKEGAALAALNAQGCRKIGVRRLMEATIERKAKKRRSQQAPASAAWKAG
jgi:homoserine kinase